MLWKIVCGDSGSIQYICSPGQKLKYNKGNADLT